MDSAEVLRALEAELRAIDVKRAELARAIETIRRILVGKPDTAKGAASPSASPSPSPGPPQDERDTIAARAVAYIREAGGRAKMTDIVAGIGDDEKDERSQYGNIYSALKRRSEIDPTLKLVEPGVWQSSRPIA